jgi:hypothetical protein
MTRHEAHTSTRRKRSIRIGIGMAVLALAGTGLVVANTASADFIDIGAGTQPIASGRIPGLDGTDECSATLSDRRGGATTSGQVNFYTDIHLIDAAYDSNNPDGGPEATPFECVYQGELSIEIEGSPPAGLGRWHTGYADPSGTSGTYVLRRTWPGCDAGGLCG